MKKTLGLSLLFLISCSTPKTQETTLRDPASIRSPLSVLLVTAHPDDESCMTGVLYKIAKEQGGIVDQLVITNGEGGYKYSLLAEKIYGLELTQEEVGRRELPNIRKQELLNSGKIMGIRKHIFLDEKDHHFTLDPKEALEQWDTTQIKKTIQDLITFKAPGTGYDYILVLLPTEDTHGHHKAATLLTLDVLTNLDQNQKKPIILGCDSTEEIPHAILSEGNPKLIQKEIKRDFKGLSGYPSTEVEGTTPIYQFDRNTSFGYKNSLNYQIIMSWVIAEHKSQGFFQTQTKQYRYENYWYFKLNGKEHFQETKNFLSKVLSQ